MPNSAVGLQQSLCRFLTYVISTNQTTLLDPHYVSAEVEPIQERGGERIADYTGRFLARCWGFENDKGIQYSLNRQSARGLQDEFVRHLVAPLVNEAESLGEMFRRAQEAERTRRVARRDDKPDSHMTERRFAGVERLSGRRDNLTHRAMLAKVSTTLRSYRRCSWLLLVLLRGSDLLAGVIGTSTATSTTCRR